MNQPTYISDNSSAAKERSRRPLRVALLTNENTPYRVPLYRELASTPGWDFRVYTCIEREHDRLWNIADTNGFITKKSFSLSYKRSRNVDGAVLQRQVHFPLGIVSDVLKFRPDVVFSNEFGVRTLLASLTSKLMGHRLIVYSESTPHTERNASRRQLAVRRFLSQCPNAYICNGVQARQFLENLGVKPHHIFEVGQALDVDSFQHCFSDEDRQKLRAEMKIQGICFLFVGHLNKHKGTSQLVEAWQEFSARVDGDCTLLMAGEGNNRTNVEAYLREHNVTNVRILGFVQRKELARIYGASDAFVFPTLGDCFSLAFEEAMAASLPVIGSIYGGESELVVEGENGWVCDPLNHDDLVSKLMAAFEAAPQLRSMGERARTAVEEMSIEKVAARMRKVVEHVLRRPKTATRAASI
jgi:glycosyltransferase involved in cell wall biosynthesis